MATRMSCCATARTNIYKKTKTTKQSSRLPSGVRFHVAGMCPNEEAQYQRITCMHKHKGTAGFALRLIAHSEFITTENDSIFSFFTASRVESVCSGLLRCSRTSPLRKVTMPFPRIGGLCRSITSPRAVRLFGRCAPLGCGDGQVLERPHCLNSVCAVLQGSCDHRVSATSSDVLEAEVDSIVMAAMARHPQHAELQQEGSAVLCHLCAHSSLTGAE